METIKHTGVSPFLNDSSYAVYRNVKDFGAKGDGKTDDTAAIQAAIDGTRLPSSKNTCISLSANIQFQLADVAYGDAAQEILRRKHSSPRSSISPLELIRSRERLTATSSHSSSAIQLTGQFSKLIRTFLAYTSWILSLLQRLHHSPLLSTSTTKCETLYLIQPALMSHRPLLVSIGLLPRP